MQIVGLITSTSCSIARYNDKKKQFLMVFETNQQPQKKSLDGSSCVSALSPVTLQSWKALLEAWILLVHARYTDMKIRGETKVEQARGCWSQPSVCTPIGIWQPSVPWTGVRLLTSSLPTQISRNTNRSYISAEAPWGIQNSYFQEWIYLIPALIFAVLWY